jgi:two-component system chemotaxis response regulator CheY
MSKTCLVVDDVEVSRYSSQLVLEELGFKIVEAADGDECLAAIQKNRPDAILMDWHLRRQSGLELIARLREIPGAYRIPVIVFSGIETENAEASAKAAGANGFISKPTSKEKLEAEFKRLGLL